MKKNINNAGFTLLEIVITTGLIIAILGSFIGLVLTVQQTKEKIQGVEEVESNVRIAIEFMNNRIRSAQGVNAGSSVFDTDPGVLSLSMSDAAKNPTIFSLDQNDGVLQMKEGVQPAVPLTTKDVKVSQLKFSNYSQTGERIHVPITLSVTYSAGQDSYAAYTENIQTSVSARR